MANYVRVSSICCPALSIDSAKPARDIVAEIKAYLLRQIEQVLPDKPDLIVLPEECDRPVGINEPRKINRYYQERGDKILQAFQRIARNNHCYLTYPAIRIMPDGTKRNSIQLIDRAGRVGGVYNKHHVTTWESEGGVLYGRETSLIECDFGRVACVICFDLNFDGLRLKYKAARPDLLIFSSMFHGGLLQNYWAYSCGAHLVSAISGNRGNVINPLGEIIAHTTNYTNYITVPVNLDCALVHLDGNRDKLRTMKEKYDVDIRISDPGDIGQVMISSETNRRTAQQMTREFGIELRDDYFARVLAHRLEVGRVEP